VEYELEKSEGSDAVEGRRLLCGMPCRKHPFLSFTGLSIKKKTQKVLKKTQNPAH